MFVCLFELLETKIPFRVCMFLGIVVVVGCMEVMKFADELSLKPVTSFDVRNRDKNRSFRKALHPNIAREGRESHKLMIYLSPSSFFMDIRLHL